MWCAKVVTDLVCGDQAVKIRIVTTFAETYAETIAAKCAYRGDAYRLAGQIASGIQVSEALIPMCRDAVAVTA